MALDTVRVGNWILQADVQRTKAAHAKLTESGADECSCDGCKNFVAVRAKFLEGPLGSLLDQLGISPPWEVEVYEIHRVSPGVHMYGGWFHFVGSIEPGSPVARAVESPTLTEIKEFESISPKLSVWFDSNAVLVREPFEGLPLVQLEFSAELPWVIDAPEPG